MNLGFKDKYELLRKVSKAILDTARGRVLNTIIVDFVLQL